MRRYVVSPVTGITVAAVVAAASAIMGGRPGQYRIGFKNAQGEVTLARDIRTQAILLGAGVNLLPWLADKATSVPVVSGVTDWLANLPVLSDERVQDYAGLAAAAALISLFSSEGVDMMETGKFLGLPVPQKMVDLLRGLGGGEPAPALPEPEAPALAVVA